MFQDLEEFLSPSVSSNRDVMEREREKGRTRGYK